MLIQAQLWLQGSATSSGKTAEQSVTASPCKFWDKAADYCSHNYLVVKSCLILYMSVQCLQTGLSGPKLILSLVTCSNQPSATAPCISFTLCYYWSERERSLIHAPEICFPGFSFVRRGERWNVNVKYQDTWNRSQHYTADIYTSVFHTLVVQRLLQPSTVYWTPKYLS